MSDRKITLEFNDTVVRQFLLATLIWGIVGMLVGVLIASLLNFWQANLKTSWLTFGRLRPLHTNAVIFAFVGNMMFAGIYYSTQRLVKARLASNFLSQLHFWGWQAIIVAAAITLPVAAITMLLRRPSVRKPIFLLALAMIPCALAAWPSVRHIIVYRLERTQTDVQRVEAGQYGMDVGYRLACWQAAWEMFLKRPVGGAGAGGFHFAALETSQAKTLAVSSHAHSLYLHVLGCTGAVGAGILMGVMIASLRRTWRTAPDYPYADGVFFAAAHLNQPQQSKRLNDGRASNQHHPGLRRPQPARGAANGSLAQRLDVALAAHRQSAGREWPRQAKVVHQAAQDVGVFPRLGVYRRIGSVPAARPPLCGIGRRRRDDRSGVSPCIGWRSRGVP